MRAFVRARATGSAPGEVLIAAGAPDWGGGKKKPSLPSLDAAQALRLHIPPGPEPVVVYGELPKSVGGARGAAREIRDSLPTAPCSSMRLRSCHCRTNSRRLSPSPGRSARRQRRHFRRVRQMREDLRHFNGPNQKTAAHAAKRWNGV